MKKTFCIILIVFFVLSLMVLTGCEKVRMVETEELEEIGSMEKVKIAGDPWGGDCFGYACYRVNGKHKDETLTKMPEDEYETGTINDNVVAEWEDHAAYVRWINQLTGEVTVDEYIPGSGIQYSNVHEIGENHSILGDAWYRWVRQIPYTPPPPPDPVGIDIYGETQLAWYEEDEFVAIPHDGYTPYSNFKWWWRISGGGGPDGKGGGIEAPPPGEWEYLSGHEGQTTITWGFSVSFELKCRVYDKNQNTAEDVHSVIVTQ